MLMLKTLLLATALVGTSPDEKAPATDLSKLQGEWVTKIGPLKQFPIYMVFANSKVIIKGTFNDDPFEIAGEVKLNEKASPKTLDIVGLKATDGDEVKDILGLYKLEGDKLTLCSGQPGEDRPTEFKAGENGKPMLSVFTRKGAEDKPADAAKAELGKLKGVWKAMVGPNKDRPVTVTFADAKVVAKLTSDQGNEVEVTGEAVVDPSASPKTIDFVKFKRENGDEIGDNLGIYKLDGDSLTIHTGGPGNARPTDFKSDDDASMRLLTLTREKK